MTKRHARVSTESSKYPQTYKQSTQWDMCGKTLLALINNIFWKNKNSQGPKQ